MTIYSAALRSILDGSFHIRDPRFSQRRSSRLLGLFHRLSDEQKEEVRSEIDRIMTDPESTEDDVQQALFVWYQHRIRWLEPAVDMSKSLSIFMLYFGAYPDLLDYILARSAESLREMVSVDLPDILQQFFTHISSSPRVGCTELLFFLGAAVSINSQLIDSLDFATISHSCDREPGSSKKLIYSRACEYLFYVERDTIRLSRDLVIILNSLEPEQRRQAVWRRWNTPEWKQFVADRRSLGLQDELTNILAQMR